MSYFFNHERHKKEIHHGETILPIILPQFCKIRLKVGGLKQTPLVRTDISYNVRHTDDSRVKVFVVFPDKQAFVVSGHGHCFDEADYKLLALILCHCA
jgi:hypothetical protein